MKVPQWLRAEIDELGRRVLSGELDREEALGVLADRVFEKDEDLARAIASGWLSGELERWLNARKRETATHAEQAFAGQPQGSFDEICSDYWPRGDYGPRSTLEDLEKHHEDLLAMSERYSQRCEERGRRLRELLDAVGGKRTATWEEAERKRLGLDGDAAAEG